jgi:A/G-specific adenine glycosylase
LLPRAGIEAYTQALMDLGAMVCLRSTPDCARCPVAGDCVARLADRIDELPTPRPRKPLPRREVSVLLIGRGEEILLERRPPTGIWAGLWSLPEVERGADVAAFCRERFGADVEAGAAMTPIEHTFTHFRLRLTPLPCTVGRWPARMEDSGRSACLWLPLPDATGAALPAPIKKLLRSLADRQTTA